MRTLKIVSGILAVSCFSYGFIFSVFLPSVSTPLFVAFGVFVLLAIISAICEKVDKARWRKQFREYQQRCAAWVEECKRQFERDNGLLKEQQQDSVLQHIPLDNPDNPNAQTSIAVMGFVRGPDLKVVVRIADANGLSEKCWKRSVRQKTFVDKSTGLVTPYYFITLNGKEYKLKVR